MEEHLFAASADWSGCDAGQGVVGTAGLSPVAFSLPAEFGGTVPGTNPEELLLASLATCLAITTGCGLEAREIEASGVHVEVVGKVLRRPTRFESFEVTLRVSLPSSADESTRARALEFASRADSGCMVSKIVSKSAPVTVTALVE